MRPLHSLGALALSAAMACGGGGGGSDGGPTGPNDDQNPRAPGTSATVTMRSSSDVYGAQSFRFDPSSVGIVRGGTVTWTNATSEAHNVTFARGDAPADIPDGTGGSTSRRFDATGTFDYECTNHPGMTGRVTVQ